MYFIKKLVLESVFRESCLEEVKRYLNKNEIKTKISNLEGYDLNLKVQFFFQYNFVG